MYCGCFKLFCNVCVFVCVCGGVPISCCLCCPVYCLCVNVYCTVLYYCHRVSTQFQLRNTSYHLIHHIVLYMNTACSLTLSKWVIKFLRTAYSCGPKPSFDCTLCTELLLVYFLYMIFVVFVTRYRSQPSYTINGSCRDSTVSVVGLV